MNKGDLANRMYDILVDTCGAKPEERFDFLNIMSNPKGVPEAYKFGGALGPGGKVWPIAFMVSCHKSDQNSERKRMMISANTKLAELRNEVMLDGIKLN